jgi:hypothetical protein
MTQIHLYDLVIRNGQVIDGSGSPAFSADVAVKDGKIILVGTVTGSAAQEIDAGGKLVTPGFVDIHTHYDGQAIWDQRMTPSSWHGVTTVVMGNCGVGFAPVRPADREALIELMEGVEDIPGACLHQGLHWTYVRNFRMVHCAFMSWVIAPCAWKMQRPLTSNRCDNLLPMPCVQAASVSQPLVPSAIKPSKEIPLP